MTAIDFLMFLLVLTFLLTFAILWYGFFKCFRFDKSDNNVGNLYSTHTVVNKKGTPSSLSNEEGISMIYTALSEIKDKLDNP